MTDRFYVSTPIYYVNDRPHIGHAYCTILADAARRYQALCGKQTYFVTGTDEHGQKVEQAAHKRGIDPQTHVDELHAAFRNLWPEIGCDPDQFIRTTEPRHKAVVQRALQQLWDQGLIVAREFEGWYSTAAERFWTEKELVDGKCPDTGLPVVRLKEKNYFFLMSRYQERLIAAIERGQRADLPLTQAADIADEFIEILPAGRGNEVLGFLRQPLQDLCISRPKERLKWGIELPFDADYVTYVWFDALLNYVTAVGGLGADAPGPGQRAAAGQGGLTPFETWWPVATHFLGKDILTTHAVYWPTMLMALGVPVPRRLLATGWWLIDSTKMSKSLGNVVNPLSLKDKYGAEVLRYFLLREMPVGQDANFSEEALVRRNNSDLANDLGNLVQRVIALCLKYFDGRIPQAPADRAVSKELRWAIEYGQWLVRGGEAPALVGGMATIGETVAEFKLHKTLADAMALVQGLNLVMTADAPFKTVRDDKDAAALTLYHVLEGIRFAAHLLSPALPRASVEILRRIGWAGELQTLAQLRWGELAAGAPVHEGAPIFPRFEWKPEELPAPASTPQTEAEAALAATVDIDTFARMDLRVGRVLSAEPVPKSKKLLKLHIDLGEPTPRQILSGIAETVAPADLVDKQVLVIANLPPRLMMGMESRGMLLVAEDAQGKRVPLHPARDVPNGSGVK